MLELKLKKQNPAKITEMVKKKHLPRKQQQQIELSVIF